MDQESTPEEEEQCMWLKHLDEEATGGPGGNSRRRPAAESLQSIKAHKWTRHILIVWGVVLLLDVAYLAVNLAARGTKRGKDNDMWLVTAAVMDCSLVLGSLMLSALGLWMRDEIYMRQSSVLQLITASWYAVQASFNMVFVVILSKIGGEWQRYGKYSQKQIENFNSFVMALVILGALLAPLTLLCSKPLTHS